MIIQKVLHICRNKHRELERNLIHIACNLAKLAEADESITLTRADYN